MTKVTQISTAVFLAVIASTAFTATAQASAAKERCKETGFSIFKTACNKPKVKVRFKRPRYTPPTAGAAAQNFRARTHSELGLRSVNGGGAGGAGNGGAGGAGNGGAGGAGNGGAGNGGAAGGRP